MNRLTIVVLFSVLAIGIVSLAIAMTKSSSAAIKPPVINELAGANLPSPPGVINGLNNPELIPDRTAYSILFRLIADRETLEEKNRVESYIRGMLNIGCKSCSALVENGKMTNIGNADRNPEQEQADIDAVFATAEEFNRQVKLLDNQAKDIKERRHNDPQAKLRLTALQAQKNSLIEDKTALLIQRLSPISRNKLQSFMNERLKQRIKIIPAQSLPPKQYG